MNVDSNHSVQAITPPSDTRNTEHEIPHAALRQISLTAIAALLLVGVMSESLGDESKGWFGFTLNVDAEGIFNPTLNSIAITEVTRPSPANDAGLLKGDVVETVDGIVVHGAAANELKTHLAKKSEETLTLGVRHLDGTSNTAVVIAREHP